jgi:hypothetical protein
VEKTDPLSQFLEMAEVWKKDPTYQTMPLGLRDFFNQEIGRMSALIEIATLKDEKK